MTRTARARRWLPAVAVLGLASCAGLLGLRRPDGPHPFEHRAHVLHGVGCLRCHAGVDKTGDSGPPHIPGTPQCLTCHDKPHTTQDCSGCHGMPGAREAAAEARIHLKFRHDTHVARVRGNCVRCHVNVREGGMALRPSMATCLGCHAHRDQFKIRDCGACHENLADEHVTPEDHVVHDGDFMREHGARAASARELCASCHKETFCASCHGVTVPALRERLAFDQPTTAGVHRAGFLSRHGDEARSDPALCSTCHTAETFCAGCHADKGVSATAEGAVSPHPPGWLGPPGGRNDHGRAAWRDPAACAGCHGGAGEALCIGCHREGGIGGSPHPAGWSSSLDKRRDLPCRMCHGVGP